MGPWQGSGTTVFDIAKTEPHWRVVYREFGTGKQFTGFYPYFERPYLHTAWNATAEPVALIRVIPK